MLFNTVEQWIEMFQTFVAGESQHRSAKKQFYGNLVLSEN